MYEALHHGGNDFPILFALHVFQIALLCLRAVILALLSSCPIVFLFSIIDLKRTFSYSHSLATLSLFLTDLMA